MFVFNLIPIPPLDGSRVLYAFSPEPVQDFMRSIERFGLFIIIALILIGGFDGVLVRLYNDVLSLIGRV
jgi:Zn-dependent protease